MCFSLFAPRPEFEIYSHTVRVSLEEAANERNPGAFSKDSQGAEKRYTYGGQTIRQRFREDFEDIEWLEEDTDEFNDATNTLKENINNNFQEFLNKELGPNRVDLRDDINFRFSQKAVTTIVENFNKFTQKEFNTTFMGRNPVTSNITLHIPKEETEEPISIIATMQTIFDWAAPTDLSPPKSLEPPMRFSANAKYLIPQNGKTEATVTFSFRPKR